MAVAPAQIDVEAISRVKGRVDESGDLLVGRGDAHVCKQWYGRDLCQRTRGNGHKTLQYKPVFVCIKPAYDPVKGLRISRCQPHLLSHFLEVGMLRLIKLVWRPENCCNQRTQAESEIVTCRLILRAVAGRRSQVGEPEIAVYRGVINAVIHIAELWHKLRLAQLSVEFDERVRIAFHRAGRVGSDVLQHCAQSKRKGLARAEKQ